MPFRNAATTTINTATTSHVVTLPTYKKGDIVVAAGTFFGASGAPTNAGWNLITSGILTGTSAYYGHYSRKMDGTEGSTVTFTSGSSQDSVWAVASYKDVSEKDAAVTTAVLTGTGSLAAVAATTVQDNEDVIQLVSANGASSGSAATPPTGYTERSEVWTGSFSNTSEISDIAQSTHGSTGTPTMTITNGGFLRTVITTITLTNLTYFGNANSGGATRTLSANTDYAETFQAGKTGNITQGKARLTGGGAGTANVRFIVYNSGQAADADPTGFTVLGYSDAVAIGSADAAATIEFAFTTPVAVVSGTWYAIGVQADNTVVIDCSGTGAFYNGADTYSDGPAATYPSGGSQSGANRMLSVQAGIAVSLVTNAVATLSATVTMVPTIARSTSKKLAASVLMVPNLEGHDPTKLKATVAIIPKVLKQPRRTLKASANIAPSVGKFWPVTLPTAVAHMISKISRVFTAPQQVGTVGTAAALSVGGGAPPTPTTMFVAGNTITVTFTDDLSSVVASPSWFALLVNGVSRPVVSATPAGPFLYLTVGSPIAYGAATDLTYTPGNLLSNGVHIAGFHLVGTSETMDDSIPQLITHGGYNDLTH